MNRFLRIVSCGLLMLLAGCSSLSSLDKDWINRILYTPTPAATKAVKSTPSPTQVNSSTGEPAVSQPSVLRIWIPPQFNPNANNSAAALLKQHLAAFEAEHPGLEIDVRIKAEEGEADLLNSLSITSMAAPAALPDLIALPRSALEDAAQKGLIRPLDDFSVKLKDTDLYPYARDLAKVDGTPYGIPFAGDALVIVYRPDLVWIKSWDDILLSENQLIFAGADPFARVGLSLYMSAGGEVLDAQRHPTLDQEVLTQVLELFSKGRAANLFPSAAANLSSTDQVLQEYRTRRAEMAIVRFSDYHATQDGLVQPLMGLKEAHFTFASGWLWALPGENAANKAVSAELAEFLTAADFLPDWIRETGYLPTHRLITDQSANSPIPAIIEAMQPGPSPDTVLVLGPVMQEALTRVLNGEQPEAVARSVVEKLK